jgi:hypothetical protein
MAGNWMSSLRNAAKNGWYGTTLRLEEITGGMGLG